MAETPTTSRMGFIYPARGQSPFFDVFQALMNQIDAAVWAGVEDPNLVIRGGGNIVLDVAADELSWTEDIEILSLMTGGKITIEAVGSPLTGFEDGKIAYVEVARPVSGASIKTLQIADTIGDDRNAVFVALRSGTDLLLRNAGRPSAVEVSGVTSGSVADSGGTASGSFLVGSDAGLCAIFRATETAGASTAVVLELYDDDPSTGNLVYQGASWDADAADYVDKDVFGFDGLTNGKLWWKVTNNGGTAVTVEMSWLLQGLS